MKVAFYILGPPRPLLRHRDRRGGGKYDPSVKDKEAVVWALKAQYKGRILEGALKLSATFVFSRPKSHYRTGKHAGELKPDAPYYHTSKPDTSNLVKLIEDALNPDRRTKIPILYHDDSQIAKYGEIEKVYGETPGTVVRIEEVE